MNSRGERFDEEDSDGEYHNPRSLSRDGGPTFSVRVPIVVNTEEYEKFPSEFRVRSVLEERQRNVGLYYTCRFDDGHIAEVSGRWGVGIPGTGLTESRFLSIHSL